MTGSPPTSASALAPARGGRGETPIAEMRGVSKSFFGVAANQGVDLVLQAGEVHALLGENGAGKSTLCSILAGLYRQDSGEVLIDGQPSRFRSPQDALAAGVGMVYQHYRLVSGFTVAENMMLGHPEMPFSISSRSLRESARSVMDRFGIHVDPGSYVDDLSVGEQQRVEILKLLNRGVRVLVLDEPTAVLSPGEVDALFTAIRQLAAEGRAIVFVSHKLYEVTAVSDRVTVLRDGARVACRPTKELDQRTLARLMVDRDLGSAAATIGAAAGEGSQEPARNQRGAGGASPRMESPRTDIPVLEVRDLVVRDERDHQAVTDASLRVYPGEVVGVAGVAGNGQRQLADAIAGLLPAERGEILLRGNEVTRASVRERVKQGCAYVPEDRLETGVAPGLTLEENLALRSYWQSPVARGPFVSLRAMARRAEEEVARFDIRGGRPGLPIRILSGGNLQRAILAREISADPAVLIAACPTRGLDVGAIDGVHRLLREERGAGVGVLLISEDLEELLALTDRIIVLYEGRIVGEMPTAAADRERLGLLMAGVEDAA
ncbi:MAG: ral nucleoside transport system ATP-binding protein [Thermoleophilaceae bacterium]|nr:ral nucleoside transport system ATP-binding protein [Thermoleophilaceae bacterium]